MGAHQVSLPPLPPGAKLDEPEELPPLPPGAKLDQVTSEPQTAQHNYLPKGGAGWLEPGSTSGAMLRGFGQGESMGFADELNGLVIGAIAGLARAGTNLAKSAPGRALVRKMLDRPELSDEGADQIIEAAAQRAAYQGLGMGGPSEGSAPGLPPAEDDAAAKAGYRTGRNAARLENVQAQKTNPWAYAGANLAGAVASPIVPPVARGPMTLAKAGSIAKGGAAMGGAFALGQGGSDLTRYENEPQVIMDTVGDVALGAGGGGILAPVAAVGGDRAVRSLRTGSQNSALKALGLRAGISDQLGKRGYETADEARELAQRAMDMGLIRPGRTASDVAERAGFARERAGAGIEAALQDADAMAITPGAGFDAERGAWRAAGNVMGAEGLSPTAIRESRRAQRLVEDVRRLPAVQDSTFANANRLKSDMYAGINYGTDPVLKTRLERRAASGVRQSIEEQIAETAGPEVADNLRVANRDYGHLSDIEPLAREEANRQLARKTLTPLDIASALGATAAGHAAGGNAAGGLAGAAVIGSKLFGARIPSTMASLQGSMSRPLSLGGQTFAPSAAQFFTAGGKAATQPPLKPSLEQEEEDAVQAFLSGMP